MVVSRWLLDKSAAVRLGDPVVAEQVAGLGAGVAVCDVGALEQLFSARSARDYDALEGSLRASFDWLPAPGDLTRRALALQHDLAHHHGLWHRIPIPDLLIAETALSHDVGVVHVDRDFDRIAEVRPLRSRRLRTS